LIDLPLPNKNMTKTHLEEKQKPWGAGLFLLLAALSGSCGLAYEIVYMRLFSNYFGNSFVMSGIILTAVFFGIAFGAWQNTRFIRALAYIEISIGLYAVAVITAFSFWGFELASFGGNVTFNALKLILLLGLPAFLIGTCVPLFSKYAEAETKVQNGIFTRIYAVYNLGAFLSVLVIEFILFRHMGIFLTGLLIGCLNLLIGTVLLIMRASNTVIARPKEAAVKDARIFTALFLASVASGVFQLFVLRLSFAIFGPLAENFAIILTSAILGVALGAWLAMGKWVSFDKVILFLAFGVLIFLGLTPVFIELRTFVSGLALSGSAELVAKIVLLGGYPLVIFVFLGSLVPLAVKMHSGKASAYAGPLLAVSSLGNGVGALLMFAVLYQSFSLPIIGGFIFGLLFLGSIIVAGKDIGIGQFIGRGIVLAALLLFSIQLWPDVALLLGYKTLANPEQMAYRLARFKDAISYKAYDQDASLVTFSDQNTSLIMNGYGSLTFGPESRSVLHETIVGATPGLFSKDSAFNNLMQLIGRP